MNPLRERTPSATEYSGGPVVYWMNRDQRVKDNWAFVRASELARLHRVPLVVAWNLVPAFLGGDARSFRFKVRGIKEVADELLALRVPFLLVRDETGSDTPSLIAGLASKLGAGVVVTDFSPLRVSRRWVDETRRLLRSPLVEVDAHNIVPCAVVSQKAEYGAYTIRPKIHRLLGGFLDRFPDIHPHPYPFEGEVPTIDWAALLGRGGAEHDLVPGAKAGRRALERFLDTGIRRYSMHRNDPNADAQSGLSPYLHFGHVSAQRVALSLLELLGRPVGEVLSAHRNDAAPPHAEPGLRENVAAFLEELIVRRELSDNFCSYNPDYDTPEGFPDWAKRSHERHRSDVREYLYGEEEFRRGKTHDALWNAAQHELLESGKMHGYMRMYWAKKILEWTPSPEEAMRIAIALNDEHELDGRDPNGYAGIAWSIGGVHDRAWFDRPVFGQIRYMSRGGCATKFSVDAYIRRWSGDAS